MSRCHVPGRVGRWLCVLGGMLAAAGAAEGVEFPQSAQQWLNSPPLTLKQIEGKGVFLYFFNEQDPECAQRWTEILGIAKEHEDQPVLFIAVNSGAQRQVIEQYAQQVNLTWPVIIDPDRSFAKKFPIEKVTPDNGMQVAVINPNGTIGPGSWQAPQDSVQDALKFAKWNLDPKSVPEALRQTWYQVEFQMYAAAAPALKKALKASKDELKTGAEAMMAYITPLIEEKAAAADAAYDAGEKWPAYSAYAELAEKFKGYELPSNVEARKKELQSDAGVKVELAAMKTFEAAKKQSGSAAQKKKALATLKKLVKDKPDTEAAEKAQALIDELES